jgi:cell shape-determining protein MreC
VSRQKSQSLKQLKHQNPKKSAEILLKNRMDDHLTLLQENINNLSKECDKFGGATFIQK